MYQKLYFSHPLVQNIVFHEEKKFNSTKGNEKQKKINFIPFKKLIILIFQYSFEMDNEKIKVCLSKKNELK